MNTLLKILPIQTILGYFFPDSVAKFQAWQVSKTPENYVALGETAANELAAHFDAPLVPVLAAYEGIANPVIESIISASEASATDRTKAVEIAVVAALTAGAKILGSKTAPDVIQAEAVRIVGILNTEIGVV